jgi:hypothetical protein
MTDNGKDYLTIKEFSEMAGVSTQRVYQMVNQELKDFCKVFGKVKKIDIQALKFLGKFSNSKTKNIANSEQCIINALLAQLETKDNQIFELQNVIKNMQEQQLEITKSLTNSQALHAGTIKEHIESTIYDVKDEQNEKKNKFWNWILNFRRHK